MGAQIILCDGFEVIPPPEMNDLIFSGSEQSGSNFDASTVTTEEDGTVFSGDSSPGGVAEEEWPGAKPFSFYLVKQPAYDDPEIRAKIDEADQEIYCCNKRRIEISNAQKCERADMSSIFVQMEDLVSKSEGYNVVIDEKMKEFDTLHEVLGNLRCSETDQLCFTKEELDHLIAMAQYVIEHGDIGVEENDWLVKETEKSDGVILSEDSLAKKEESVTSLKLMAVDLSEVKQELEEIRSSIDYLTTQIEMIQNKIRSLDSELAFVLETRDKSYDKIRRLRIQRDKANATFFKSLAVIRKAKELAASGNVRDLEEFASSEVDRFMNHWNEDKVFRDDYVKRVSLSLYERQLSEDGRIRAPESEVHVVCEKQELFKTRKEDAAVDKTNREDSSSNSSQDGNVVTDKRKTEARKKAKEFNRSSTEESDVVDMEFAVYEIPKKEEEEVDEETLKERKREEQLEKARLAMERKRKLQEKAAAKAAIRAQKEAEKKLKGCEKKAKKKAAANSSESDHSREVINEQEKVKTSAVTAKEKQRSLFPKQRSFRYKHRGRGTEALPKVILNRRRAQKYWLWGISSAVLALVLVLAFLLLR